MNNTKRIIFTAIIAALPFAANAANIQGAMYVEPQMEDEDHPGPITNVDAPYGRINIDTDDQSHVATTAYVKGAYNSAIAAVNKVQANFSEDYDYLDGQIVKKQNRLVNLRTNDVILQKVAAGSLAQAGRGLVEGGEDAYNGIYGDISRDVSDDESFTAIENALMTAAATLSLAAGVSDGLKAEIADKRVKIYTTWDDDRDSATTEVSLVTATSSN